MKKGVLDSIIIKLCTVDLESLDTMSLFCVYADIYFIYSVYDVPWLVVVEPLKMKSLVLVNGSCPLPAEYLHKKCRRKNLIIKVCFLEIVSSLGGFG